MNEIKKIPAITNVYHHILTAIPNSTLGITPTEIFIYTYHYKHYIKFFQVKNVILYFI